MNENYKFPYYGAGEVTYDCDNPFFLHVFFKESLTEKQKERMEEKAPAAGSVEFLEKQMDLFDDVNIHVDISKGYKTNDGLYIQGENNTGYFECANSQIQAFNLDLERWLIEIHEISPIYFAYNDVKDDMYGHKVINYSNWHQWSLQQYKTILPFFETAISHGYYEYDFSEHSNYLQNILTQVEAITTLEEKHILFLYPGKLEFEEFEQGNIEPLKSITNSSYAEKVIRFFNEKLKEEHSPYLNKHAAVFLGFETSVANWVFEDLITILFTHFDEVDSDIFKKIANYFTSNKVANSFAEKAFDLTNERKYEAAVKLFTKLLIAPAEPIVESGFYTNLLWVLSNDNTGVFVNKELNELALQKCLPKGKEYPAIFFNASCLYVEMEEYEKAYEMVEIALANYFDPKTMLRQIKDEPMFKAFREKTKVVYFLQNHKVELSVNPEPRLVSYSVASHLYDLTTIKNISGNSINFSRIILFNGHVDTEKDNGHVDTEGEFIHLYNYLLSAEKRVKNNRRPLVIVNGNLKAGSIDQYCIEHLLVLGNVTCDYIYQKEITEVGETNFEYIPLIGKRYHE